MNNSNEYSSEYISKTHELEDIGLEVRSRSNPHQISALCPFHGEKNPSFYVNRHSGVYFCHGCNCRGTLVELVSHLTKCDMAACSYDIYHSFVHSVAKRPIIKNIDFYRRTLQAIQYDTDSAINSMKQLNPVTLDMDVLEFRDVLPESVQKFGLSISSIALLGSRERNTTAISIPANMHQNINDDVKMGLMQYRNLRSSLDITKHKYNTVMQKSKAVFNMKRLMRSANVGKPVFLTEGAFDAIRIDESIGKDSLPVISSYSCSVSDEQLAIILSVSRTIVCCFDNDEAGEKGYNRLLHDTKDVECIDVRRVAPKAHDFGEQDRVLTKDMLKEFV